MTQNLPEALEAEEWHDQLCFNKYELAEAGQIGGGVTGGRGRRLSRSLAKEHEGRESSEKIKRQNW